VKIFLGSDKGQLAVEGVLLGVPIAGLSTLAMHHDAIKGSLLSSKLKPLFFCFTP
jgi:hypothetical protein